VGAGGGGWSTILDSEYRLISSADGFSDALVERIKSGLRMNQAVQAVVLANQDASIKPVMDAIPGFDLRTITW
jgi:hypothetical protein